MGKFPRPKTMDIKNRQIPPQYAGHIENPVHAALTRAGCISPAVYRAYRRFRRLLQEKI